MPKEIIYTAYPDTVDGPEPRVRVDWSREASHVQIATIMPIDDRPLVPTPEGNGWFATMDRDGINKLIRTLRKARNQAFGEDA